LALSDYARLANEPMDVLEGLRGGVLFIAELTELNKAEQKGL
jgi:hypothetical protein